MPVVLPSGTLVVRTTWVANCNGHFTQYLQGIVCFPSCDDQTEFSVNGYARTILPAVRTKCLTRYDSFFLL